MTPRLTTLLLCDFAQVREQLLFVSSGGISRVANASYPAHTRLFLAMVVHVPVASVGRRHLVSIKFKYPDDAALIGTIEVGINIPEPPAGTEPGEGVNLPQVLDLAPFAFPRPGAVDVQVSIDEEPVGDLTFWLLQAASRT